MKRILYIVTKSDLGGVSKYLLELVNHLPQNLIPYFIMSSPGYLSNELEKLGYKNNIFFVPMTNSIINLPIHIISNLKTLKLIKKVKPDFIHCNSTTGGIIGRICGALTFTPVIFTAHGWAFTDGIPKAKQIFYECLETFLAFFTKKIICVSEYDRQLALKVMPFFKDKLITVHNGIFDIPDEYRKKEFSKDKLKIVMVSRLCPQKDPYTLINAVSELNKEDLDIQLDLYGYGEELQEVSDLIKSCNCSNIKYCGEISDVTPILKNYDIYALISNWEGLPIGIIEALRAGLPVIASNVGGCVEEIANGENGFLIEQRDKKQLKERIKFLYENKHLLEMYSKKSRQIYADKFIADKMCEKTYEIIKDCYENIN